MVWESLSFFVPRPAFSDSLALTFDPLAVLGPRPSPTQAAEETVVPVIAAEKAEDGAGGGVEEESTATFEAVVTLDEVEEHTGEEEEDVTLKMCVAARPSIPVCPSLQPLLARAPPARGIVPSA